MLRRFLPPAVLVLAGCAAAPERVSEMVAVPGLVGTLVETVHRGDDDLVSAGLGLDQLRLLPPPAAPDPDADTLRRRAIWSSWRGIADLRAATLADPLPVVPGREFSAQLQLPGAQHPHRVVVQLPDAFDVERPCLVVAAASGSRGVYGAIAVAATTALARGCAVAYTDKGAGSDFRLVDDTAVYVPHAHSGDNPEAQWGEHVLAAARFGLAVLDRAGLRRRPFTAADTHIVATGISNGGGAVLQAVERDRDGLLDAVVAAAPNIHSTWTGSRALYDYVTEAALYQPCLAAATDRAEAPLMTAALRDQGRLRCRLLREAGLLESATTDGQAREAAGRLHASGWPAQTLELTAQNLAFDLWRAVGVTYASAYGRFGVGAHPCGFHFAAVDGSGRPRAPSALEQALWRSDGSGIPPTAGVALLDPNLHGEDTSLPGLMCLRRLWTEDGPAALRVRDGVAATQVRGEPAAVPVTVLHGSHDALIPPAFSSRPWVAAAQARGLPVTYREIERGQHFDAFLAFPAMAGYVPILPAVWEALAEAIDRR